MPHFFFVHAANDADDDARDDEEQDDQWLVSVYINQRAMEGGWCACVLCGGARVVA